MFVLLLKHECMCEGMTAVNTDRVLFADKVMIYQSSFYERSGPNCRFSMLCICFLLMFLIIHTSSNALRGLKNIYL